MKVCAAILLASLVAGVAHAGLFAHPYPLLRTPRVYNIIVRSDGSLLPSAAYSLPLDHPIFHTAPGKAAASAKDAAGDAEQPSVTAEPPAGGADSASSPAPPPHLPALPISHVAVNFPGAANSSAAPTVVATTLPFYSLPHFYSHPLAFPIPDPTPFIHPFGPHPGYFFAPAFHAPAAIPPATLGDAQAKESAKDPSTDEKAKEEEESER